MERDQVTVTMPVGRYNELLDKEEYFNNQNNHYERACNLALNTVDIYRDDKGNTLVINPFKLKELLGQLLPNDPGAYNDYDVELMEP